MTVIEGFFVRLFKPIVDRRNIAYRDGRSIRRRNHGNFSVFPAEITTLLRPQQHFATGGFDPSPGQFNGSLPDLFGNPVEGQAVGPKMPLGHFNGYFPGTGRAQFHERDPRSLQQVIANAFGDVTQGLLFQVTVHQDGHDLTPNFRQTDNGFLRQFRKRLNAVDLVRNLLQDVIGVDPVNQLDLHLGPALGGRGGDFFHPVQSSHDVFNGQDNPLLDFFRTGTGIGHGNANDIDFELRKDFLLEVGADEQSSENKNQHDEVGRHRVVGHPSDRTGT